MPFDRFLIAPYNEGIREDLRPFLIPDDAFAELKNAYVYRGRIRKRFGSTVMDTTQATAQQPLYSRLRINLGNTDGSGNISGTAPGAVFKVGQMFSIGTEIFTVNATGTPAAMLTTGSATVSTYNTTSGAYVINGAAATTACYFYPAEPVMGITNYEGDSGTVYAFDTQFAYKYTSGSGWDRIATGTDTWTGSNSQFVWSTNYKGANADDFLLFATNNKEADGIRYWDGSTWATLNPSYLTGAGNTIETARLIIPFKDRLLLLNTTELVSSVSSSFPNRCRFSQNGSPLAADAWREDVDGKGDHIDAPIKQAIVSALIFRDRLIVFFERSTWELVYTGNQVLPFVWQQINIELGAESTFSVVPFDKAILAIGDTGIHACNGVNVERIDNKIPDEVFDFHDTTTNATRVHGIRDYRNQLVYWAIPTANSDDVFPNRVLSYNYKNNSWAIFDDNITAFGYDSSVRDVIVAGNQEGFTFKLNADTYRNSPSSQISDITESSGVVTVTIVNHGLKTGDFIVIENGTGITVFNDNIYKVTYATNNTITLVNPPIPITTYTGQGTAALVSKIDMKTKQYNFYSSVGHNTYLAHVDFYVDRTDSGQILVDSFSSSSSRSNYDDGTASGAVLGTNVLQTTPYAEHPLESTQDRFWHRVYFQTEGENAQMRLYLSDSQMTDSDIAWSDFKLNAMVIYAMKTGEF